jgi:hypothetical protein
MIINTMQDASLVLSCTPTEDYDYKDNQVLIITLLLPCYCANFRISDARMLFPKMRKRRKKKYYYYYAIVFAYSLPASLLSFVCVLEVNNNVVSAFWDAQRKKM